jgi:hypothetical protein
MLSAVAGGAWRITFVGGFSIGLTDAGNFAPATTKDYVGCYQTSPIPQN